MFLSTVFEVFVAEESVGSESEKAVMMKRLMKVDAMAAVTTLKCEK